MAKKFLSVLATMPYIANKSQINHRHSAVILKNGAPIIWGFNNIKGTRTYHAEHDAIRKYLALKCIKGAKSNKLPSIREPYILWRQQ